MVKLNQLGEGPPAREQVITEQVRRQMMAAAYKRQEELKVSAPLKYALFDIYIFIYKVKLIKGVES